MRELLEIATASVLPEPRVLLERQGVAPDARTSQRVADTAREALELFAQTAAPRGLVEEITAEDFAVVYRGEGQNEPATPLEEIYPRAEHLALFTVTLGPAITHRIRVLFDSQDFALANMLDTAASEGAERAERVVEKQFMERLRATGRTSADSRSLTYSPGYCGWHVSGQKALFARLHPEEIGVTLGESFLMQPLKSISGVIAAGPGGIHDFAAAYPFCRECETRSCRERIRRVLEG